MHGAGRQTEYSEPKNRQHEERNFEFTAAKEEDHAKQSNPGNQAPTGTGLESVEGGEHDPHRSHDFRWDAFAKEQEQESRHARQESQREIVGIGVKQASWNP